ncbi:TRAP transporter small permease [Pelobacter seleniigenes]|uniref:TRAP transporter small permease n=1 Tax=Pelobacter seleniigenes TaxID=407188 RepID=UPI0004A73DB4|nr:TRAP transporter small permease [Pelobacter seleniigenes]
MKTIGYISRGAEFISGIIGLIALFVVCYEVVGRYFAPSILTDWGAEVTVYAVIWGVFLSFGELARRGEHISADFLVANLKGVGHKIYRTVMLIVGFCFSAVLVWAGWQMVSFALMIGETGDTSLQFPKALYYLALPVGMLLQCIVYGAQLVSRKSTDTESLEV